MFCTNLVFVLGALVLHKQRQTFFPDERLGSAASAMALLWLIRIHVLVLVSRLVRLTNHLALAKVPYNLHTGFGITNVPDLLSECGVRLT